MPPENELRKWNRRPAVERPLRYARRLLAMSPREVAARLEPHLPRLATAAAAAPQLDRPALVCWLESRFLFGPQRARTILETWAQARPEPAARLVAGARRLLQEADVFGTPVRLDPQTLDWQAGPAPGCSDLRWTWELNRQQYLFTLARAHLLTGEPAFARRIGALLESWWPQNPPGRGENWSSALEVAVRSLAWLWTLPLVLAGPHPEEGLLQRWLASLY